LQPLEFARFVRLSEAVNSTTTSERPLDKASAEAIRQAIAAAQVGRVEEACSIGERALSAGGDRVALNALLGMLRTRSGDHQAAINHLEIAHAERPGDVRIATNLATALSNAGQMDRAFEIASNDLARADPSLGLLRIRGYLAQMLGDAENAVEAYTQVVERAPNDWESWNNLGNARVAAGEFEAGIIDLERAVGMAPDSAPPRLNLARAYRQSGDPAKAEQILRKMADDFPSDAMPLKDLCDLLMQSDREEESLEMLDRALEREPDDIGLLLARAGHFGLLLRMGEAEAAFREVLRRDPGNAEAFVGLAVLYEHGRPSDLADLVGEAEQRAVNDNALNLLRAFRDRRFKNYPEALAALENISPEFEALRRNDILGQMLEKVGNYDGAFSAFARMNEIQAADPTQPLLRASALRAEVRSNLEKTTKDWIDSWTPAPKDPQVRSPVFLIGFPRSGTTLLDTILMGHPDVVVLEERPVLPRTEQELGGFDALPGLTEQDIRRFRGRYFEIASEYAELPERALLVDKSPLLLTRAATIHRLFPDARIILALRHPADVVLSCFVSSFRLNNAMANFLDLETAAEFYDLTFRSWENARSLLPLNVHQIVYEELVDDPPAILRPLVEWLGLEWHDDMLHHTRTAAERGVISTASYAQVTEPIYKRSVGRWQNYRKQLEPILPILQPWAEKFGYEI
jgi:tetratricopeptide (TPR) repeat protein